MSEQPVTIVSGLPRSGTSMMMRVIAAAGIPPLTDELRKADDDNPHGYFEYEPVKTTKQNPSWLEHARGGVVKMVHLLLPDLPTGYRYRVVMMQRELDEVLASQAKMLARTGRPAAPAETLKRVYASQLQQVRKWMDGRPDVSWIEVSYNRMLAAPTEEIARVAEFLGVPEAADRMLAAVDPSLYRNRGGSR
jgi:hypothetical protein